MKRTGMEICMNLKEVTMAYEHFFNEPYPNDLAYYHALVRLVKEIGAERLEEWRKENE